MDLCLEHLNLCLKTALQNTGSNITENSVQLAAQSVAVVKHICQQFQAVTSNCKSPSNKHTSLSFERDFQLNLDILLQQEKESRQYNTFKCHKSLFDQLRFIGGLNRLQITLI